MRNDDNISIRKLFPLFLCTMSTKGLKTAGKTML